MGRTASPTQVIARQSVQFVLRERMVALLSAMFVVLVLISAWLGWQATSTVNLIYLDAAAFLKTAGQTVPPNPVLDISPLSLMRNLSVYVSLIGALAAIVIGNRLVVIDRKAGVLPLIGTRPLRRGSYAFGKIIGLICLILGLAGVAAVVSTLTLFLLPALSVTSAQWAQLAGFFGLSALYMMIFGLIGLAAAAAAQSETVGLLIPVTMWLTLTFVFPQLTANLNPTAAINPISAMAPAPDTAFFHWAAQILGPVSVADSYKFGSAKLLDFLPQGMALPTPIPPVADLIVVCLICAACAGAVLARTALQDGDYNV